MTQYFGFEPGTYQPWALNLQMDALGQSGVARGMQVQQLASPNMNVQLALDAVQGDGVCYLPNGAWARIDAIVSLSVPNNTSGSLRTDAVVIYVDPTGVSASNIGYISGWGNIWKGNNNQFVLALVNVPNNASSIVNGNIINNPLAATSGFAPQNFPDGPVGSERVDSHGCPPGIFEAIEVPVTTSATNGQTSFSIPLTNLQRLVPQGRIGGALETGFFAGPNGWYWPKLRGSVSGLLPVGNVDSIGGNLIAANGAQTGETVYASFRYYDFGRDAKVRSGGMFLEKNSPYLVYQGEVIEDRTLGQQYPLWDGTTGAYLLLNPGESVFYTDFFTNCSLPFIGGPGVTSTQVNIYTDGTLNFDNFTSAAGAPASQLYRSTWNNMFPSGLGPHVMQLSLVAGILAMGGVRSWVTSGSSVFVSGGVVNVQGQPVLLQSTSFALPTPNSGYQDSYVIYTDKYGNISSSGTTLTASEDRILGRVPLASAVQYASPVGPGIASSNFGSWALPGSYLGWPAEVVLTSGGSASVNTALSNGWSLQPDSLSPNGAYLTTTSQFDLFHAQAVCTGMDLLVRTGGATGMFTVWVDKPVNQTANYSVRPVGTTQYNVRLTLFSGLPYGTHSVHVQYATTAGNIGLDALDIRVPASPAPPSGTVALAQVDTFGTSCLIRPSLARGTQVGATGQTSAFVLDAFRPGADPAVWLSNNTSSNSMLVLPLFGTGGYTVHYQAGPDKGIISLASFSIDCYSAGVVSETTVLVATGGNVSTVTFSSGGQKNASASGWGVILNGIDFFPWYNHVTDLRRYGVGHGYASELRGSSLQTHLGGRLDDGGQGIRADQIRDRGITSRKIAPAWQRTVTTTQASSVSGIDPLLNTSITVEVPSMLLVSSALPMRANANTYAYAALLLDGANANLGGSGYVAAASNPSNNTGVPFNMSFSELIPVPAGTHLLQVYFSSGFGANIYSDAGQTRSLSVLAFAL